VSSTDRICEIYPQCNAHRLFIRCFYVDYLYIYIDPIIHVYTYVRMYIMYIKTIKFLNKKDLGVQQHFVCNTGLMSL